MTEGVQKIMQKAFLIYGVHSNVHVLDLNYTTHQTKKMLFVTSHQFWKDRLPFSTILKIRRDVFSYNGACLGCSDVISTILDASLVLTLFLAYTTN